MAFIDVVTLAEAKAYLRVDDGFTEDDSLITLLINAAGDYLEKYTNHLLYSRDKTYQFYDGCVRVYDYPINSQVSVDTVESEVLSLYTLYEGDDEVTLNVGYDVADVPFMLKVKMFEVIDAMYNGNENASVTNISDDLFESITLYRRFMI